MKKYFDIHCEFDGDSTSYSIFVEIDSHKTALSSTEIISFCIDNNLFSEIGDEKFVDSITEITEEEYYRAV